MSEDDGGVVDEWKYLLSSAEMLKAQLQSCLKTGQKRFNQCENEDFVVLSWDNSGRPFRKIYRYDEMEEWYHEKRYYNSDHAYGYNRDTLHSWDEDEWDSFSEKTDSDDTEMGNVIPTNQEQKGSGSDVELTDDDGYLIANEG